MKKSTNPLGTAPAPELAPPKPPAPPPKDEVQSLAELVSDRKQRLELARLIAQVGELGQQKSKLEKQIEPLQTKIKEAAGKLGIRSAISGDWRVSYYTMTRTTIKQDKLIRTLLAHGVQPKDATAIASEASDTSESYTLRIQGVKAAEAE